jgi:hypothetical protein
MFMYDPRLGQLDVEMEIPDSNPHKAFISTGYKMDTFEDLTEDELDYLNEEYSEHIVIQAANISTLEELEAVKLLH